MKVICECGINHNGSVDTALKLCDAAKEAGADFVKFQLYTMDNLFIPEQLRAKYDKLKPVLYDCMLEKDDFVEIKEYCDNIGIPFTATPEDIDGADFLIDLGVPFIKVGSRQALNADYVFQLVKRNCRAIVSNGLDSSIRVYDQMRWNEMYCVSKYPAEYDDINWAILTGDYNGLSDHTMGISAGIVAAHYGVGYLEKHMTLNRTMDGPDHFFALEPDMFKIMVEAIREVSE